MVGMKSKRSASRKSKSTQQADNVIPYVAVPLMVIGVICILASFALSSVPTDVVWSDEQAIAHQEASNRFHRDQFDKSLSESELAKSREAFEEIDEQLSRAKGRRNGIPIIVRWIGIVCTGLGYVVLLVVRSNQD